MADLSDALKESTEALPPSDVRDAAVKEIDSMCRELVETVHQIMRLNRTNNERMIGRLEERIFTMTDAIHARQRKLYLDDGINVTISHTSEGLPIRVAKAMKLTIWGSPA